MKKYFVNLFIMTALVILPQCKSTENRFTVSPDQPLREFSAPVDRNTGSTGTGFTGAGTGFDPTASSSGGASDSGSSNLNISSPALQEFMVSEGNPSEWGTVSFDRVQKIAEFFCSDCHTPGIWYGDSSTREFYTTGKVKNRVVNRTMPSPVTSYSKLMDEAEAAGFDYRAAMFRYIDNQ